MTEVREADEEFRIFFDREYVRLARALFLLTGNGPEAEDLAQEAMVRVFERWDRVARMESPTGYVFRTAMNLYRSRLRRLRHRARRTVESANTGDPGSVVETRDEIARAMDRLTVAQRQTLVLVEWLGFDAEEAGRLLGIAPVSVRVRLSRARRTLQESLEEDP